VTDIAALVADNIHIWTGAIQRKSGGGRGGGKRISLYGIERLRALILDLAVRGKLVPQDAGDETAAKLLARIGAIKPGYLEKHGLPKQRALNGQPKSAAFQVPASWAWTRLGDIAAYLQRGRSPKYSEGSGVFVVSQRCVQWAGLDLDVAKEISRESLDNYEPYRFLQKGDILWNSTGTGTIGRVIALDDVNDGFPSHRLPNNAASSPRSMP
jgi:type I restriction enzyme S subunit